MPENEQPAVNNQAKDTGVAGDGSADDRSATWAGLFKDNWKMKQATHLDQYEAKGERVSFEYDDLDNVEDTRFLSSGLLHGAPFRAQWCHRSC